MIRVLGFLTQIMVGTLGICSGPSSGWTSQDPFTTKSAGDIKYPSTTLITRETRKISNIEHGTLYTDVAELNF